MSFLVSNPNLRDFIETIHAHHTIDTEHFWIYQLHTISLRLPSARFYVDLDGSRSSNAEGPHDNTRNPFPLISSTTLPRTIPSSMIPVYYLILSDLRLKRRQDLLRFVLSLPRVMVVSLIRISFVEESPAQQVLIRRRPHLSSNWQVEASDCEGSVDVHPQLVLLLSFYFAAGMLPIRDTLWMPAVITISSLFPPVHYDIDLFIGIHRWGE